KSPSSNQSVVDGLLVEVAFGQLEDPVDGLPRVRAAGAEHDAVALAGTEPHHAQHARGIGLLVTERHAGLGLQTGEAARQQRSGPRVQADLVGEGELLDYLLLLLGRGSGFRFLAGLSRASHIRQGLPALRRHRGRYRALDERSLPNDRGGW